MLCSERAEARCDCECRCLERGRGACVGYASNMNERIAIASAVPGGRELAFLAFGRIFFSDPPALGFRERGFGPPHVLHIFYTYC